MIVGSGNDFSPKGMISRDVNPAIIPNETIIHLHATVVVEGSGNGVVPEVNVPGSYLYVSVGLFDGGHDHGSEVFGG